MKHGALILISDNVYGKTGGHDAAYSMIKEVLGNGCEIKKTELGAPYIEGSEKHISVSHSSALIVCAISDVPIGVDTEPRDRKVPENVVSRITGKVDPDPVVGWTKIESSLKLFGHGLDRIRDCDEFIASSNHTVRFINGSVVTVATKKEDGKVAVMFKTVVEEKKE